MIIGFISSQFPLDIKTSVYGGHKRMGMFIQALKEIGNLDMLFFVRPEVKINTIYVAEMEERLGKHWSTNLRLDLCNMACVKPARGRWQEYITPSLNIVDHPPYLQTAQKNHITAIQRLLSRKPDILFVHRLSCMIPFLLSKMHHPRIYFDLDDIEHISYSRSIKLPPLWPGKRLYYLRLPILKLWEKRAIRSSSKAFVCSENDKEYLLDAFGCKNVAVIPNAIDIPKQQEIPDKSTLLFLGLMSYLPNKVAADYLIRSIWPTIFSALPEARLLIAGAKSEHLESFSGHPPGVEFLGFIDNLEKLYKEVAVVCCPILSGGGTRIKILEAAAYGKPVVSTPIGAEGIDLRDGNEILLRDDPRSFAEACIRLLKDRNYAVKMGQAARSVVARLYERNEVIKRIKMNVNHLSQDANT